MSNRSKRKRPYWLTEPCPSWCWDHHSDNDGGPDRVHMSRWQREVPLTTMDPTRLDYSKTHGKIYEVPVTATVCLVQGYRESGPRVHVYDDHRRFELDMTTAETRKLIAALQRAVALADGGAR